MARIAIVVLAACSTRVPSLELAPPGDEAQAMAVRGVEREAPAPRVPEPTAAPHTAAIELLALDASGHAAVTADTTGSLRLWPALDGTREPLIVRAPLPAALALVTEQDAFSIGVADAAGDVTIERVSAAGVPEPAARIALARPVVRLYATTHGFVVLCDDSAIAIVDARGRVTASLATEPGQRVTSLAVHGDRVLAILPADDGSVGRWIDLAGRWGKRTPRLVIDPRHDAALSADARSLVGVVEGAEHACPDCGEIDVLDLATGHIERREPDERARVMQPLGFLDRETIAFTTPEGTRVWRNDRIGPESGVAADVAGGQLVTGFAASLTLVDASGGRRYLGYKLPALQQVVPARDGWLAANASHVVRLDRGFREVGQVAVPARLYNLALADAHHAFAQQLTTSSRVVLLDLAHPERVVPVNPPGTPTCSLYGYERATGVLAVGTSDQLAFAHFDPKTETVGPYATLALTASMRAVRLFDPELAGGRIATVAAEGLHGEDMTITDVRALYDEPALLETDEPVVQRIGARRDDPEPETFIPTPRRIRRTSPDGTRIAELDSGALALRTPAGKTVWTVAIAGASDLAWSESGELVVVGGGMAGIDLATGELVHPTCGWEFGLWNEPLTEPSEAALCLAAQ